MTLLGIDVSHWQRSVNWSTVRRAGYRFAILKATQNSGWSDDTFADKRAKARAAGLVTGAYHFAGPGDVAAEVSHFCRTVGTLQPGELIALDWEVTSRDPVGWCLAWLRAVEDRLGLKPLLYMNRSTCDGFNWTPVVQAGYPLWLARYDGSQAQPTGTRWPSVAMKQLTKTGSVPGIAGGVDVDVFYGDEAALARLGKGGGHLEQDQDDKDDDMRLNAYRVKDTAAVFAGGPGIWWHVPNTATLQGMQRNGTLGPVTDVSQAEIEAAQAVWLSAVVTTPLHSATDPRGDWGLVDRLPAIDAAMQKTTEAMQALSNRDQHQPA